MLERLGCVVDTVSNGREAADSISSMKYDVVLMDVSMPEMDGITATKKIRALQGDASRVPIVALTAYALDEDRQRVLAAGMDDFVSKPVSRIELARVLARQVTGKHVYAGSAVGEDENNLPLFDATVLDEVLADLDKKIEPRLLFFL